MKLRTTLSVTIVAMAFLVAGSAAVQAKDSAELVIYYNASVAGSQLASGTYNVQWQTHSPEATVSFMKGKKIVATAQGKVVDRGKKYSANEVVYYVTDNGARQIQELRFGGSSQVIEFNQ
ncbi:MAG: hypothetical protein WAO35_07545 [Terriglobia bacterium]